MTVAAQSSRGVPRGRRGGRIVALLVAAATAFFAALFAIDHGLTALRLAGDRRINLDLVDVVREWRVDVGERASSVALDIAMVGDSLTMSSREMATAGRLPLPERLQQMPDLQQGLPGARVHPLRWGGLGPTEVFYLADELAQSGLRFFVLTLNLASLSPSWALKLNRSGLVGWIAPHRIPATLLLPLHRVGLSADRVLWYVALRNLGMETLLRGIVRLQVRARPAPRRLARLIGEWSGADAEQRLRGGRVARGFTRDTVAGGTRLSRSRVLEAYRPILSGVGADNTALRFLRSALVSFHAAGIGVMVVAMPVNLDHWRAVGALDDEEAVRHSVATLGRQILSTGASFVDLHDLLPDEAFRDKAAHYRFDGPEDGIERVAAALAPLVAAELERSGGR